MQTNHSKPQNINKIVQRLVWYPILAIVSTVAVIMFPIALCSSQDCSTPGAAGLGYLVMSALMLFSAVHFFAFPLGIYSMFKSASTLGKQQLMPRHKQKKLGLFLSLTPITLFIISAIAYDALQLSGDTGSLYALLISGVECLLFIPVTGSGIILLSALKKWPKNG